MIASRFVSFLILVYLMHRFILIMSLILPAIGYGQAVFGIKGGLNLADIVMTNYINPDVESDLAIKAGLHAGVFLDGMVDDRIGMAAELLYSNKGVKGFSNINLHYITLPLLAQYKLTDRLSAELGPELGYMFSAESAFGNVANTYTNKFDLAIDGGFRLDSPRLIFGIRYCAGIFSVREPQESAATPGEKIKYQNRVLQISIGYKLKTIE